MECSPPVKRWNQLLEQISEQLRSSKALLGLWQRYRALYSQCAAAVHKQEERADRLLKSATDRDITAEESSAWMKECSVSADVPSYWTSTPLDKVVHSVIQSLRPALQTPSEHPASPLSFLKAGSQH